MGTKTAILFLVCVIFLAACGGVTPYPQPMTASPAFILPATMPLPTLTATPTPTQWHTPTPETLYGYPTPKTMAQPTCPPRGDCWILTPNVQRQDIAFHELYVGKYVLRSWCNVDSRFSQFDFCPYSAITIASKDGQYIEIWGGNFVSFGKEAGADLTGNGIPDIVIDNWIGGASCCQNTIIYEAGDNLIKIMDIVYEPFGTSTFTDLNGDGTYEFIVPEQIESVFCGNCVIRPSVVYEYQPKSGYVLATYKFKDVLSIDIQKDLAFLNRFTKQNPNMTFHFPDPSWYSTQSPEDKEYQRYKENLDYSRAVATIYELAAYYLLAGQQSDAQNILNKYFPPDKATEYMLGIQNDLQRILPP